MRQRTVLIHLKGFVELAEGAGKISLLDQALPTLNRSAQFNLAGILQNPIIGIDDDPAWLAECFY